jgi:hypothetical protein
MTIIDSSSCVSHIFFPVRSEFRINNRECPTMGDRRVLISCENWAFNIRETNYVCRIVLDIVCWFPSIGTKLLLFSEFFARISEVSGLSRVSGMSHRAIIMMSKSTLVVSMFVKLIAPTILSRDEHCLSNFKQRDEIVLFFKYFILKLSKYGSVGNVGNIESNNERLL